MTIVHGGVLSVADQVWITRKDDESIKKFSDLKGKKLGYSSPKSVTDILTSMMIAPTASRARSSASRSAGSAPG